MPSAEQDPVEGLEAQFLESFSERHLELILLPTEQCNFRCTYCYEDFAVGRMAPKVVAAVKALIARRMPTLDRFSLGWFGGEPLVAKSVVTDVMAHAQRLAREHGTELFGSMTTNGSLLTPAVLDKIVPLGLRQFQISLDGPAEFHDTTRRRLGGAGSFATIWKHLHYVRASDLDTNVEIRLHITPANMESLPEFAGVLRDEFLADPRFSVQFFPVEDLGGPSSGTFDVLAHDRALGVVRLLRAIVGHSEEVASNGCGAPYICYAAKPSSLVIRANGGIAKCTVAFAHPTNDIGRLLPDGSLEIDQEPMRFWVRGWTTGDADQLLCPAMGL